MNNFTLGDKIMGKILHIGLILIFVALACTSCEKTSAAPDQSEEPEVEIPKPGPPPPPAPNPTTSVTLNLGTGSGNLSIDGASLGINANTLIRIKGGTYSDIQIKNIKSGSLTVLIQNDGLVELVGNKQMRLSNLQNVIISGDGTPGLSRGFLFRDRTSDGVPVLLTGDINNFTLKNFSFKNLNTYGIIRYDSQKVFDGSESSYSKNLKFLNIDCDNTGTLIRFKGASQNNTITGLIKEIEIANVNFQNSVAVGSAVVLENVDGYDIHNNFIRNVNQQSNNHNGLFYLQGNGKFYSNYIADHQGNAIRAWVYSVGTLPAEVLIFNNIVVNSREYSGFELQAFARNMIPGKTTFVNAKVFNNTCGNLKPKSGTFPAQILDLYGLEGGQCEIFNNLGYEFPLVGQNNTNPIWNQLGNTKTVAYSNKYFSAKSGAGFSDDKFNLSSTSSAKNAGATLLNRNFEPAFLTYVNLDIYNNARNLSKPSIGAIE